MLDRGPLGDQVGEALLDRRLDRRGGDGVEARLAVEVNESFTSTDARTRVGTPMSLRAVLDRIPAGLWMYADDTDPLRRAFPGRREP